MDRLPSKPLPIIGSGKIERVRSALAAEELEMTRRAVVPHPQSRAGLRRALNRHNLTFR